MRNTAPRRAERRQLAAEEEARRDLAEADRLGEEFGLGASAAVIRGRERGAGPGAYLGQLCLVTSLLFAFIMGTVLGATSDLMPALVFGVVTLALCVPVWLLGRHIKAKYSPRRIFRYPGGLILPPEDQAEPRVLRWDDVDGVTLVFNDADETYNGLSWCSLEGADGTTLHIGGWVPKHAVREVTLEALRVLGPRIGQELISAYDSGAPISVGRWRLDPQDLTEDADGKHPLVVPWHDVREITVASENYRDVVDPPSLVTITVDGPGRRRKPRLSLSGVRNGMFLPQLLAHVAGRQGITLRRITVRP